MRTVLIVESDDSYRLSLSRLFSAQPDFQLVGSGNSLSECMLLIKEHNPELILLDENLPDGTGPDAAQAILFQSPETIIVFLSEEDDDESLFAALRAGAKGYLLKGLSQNAFMAALRGLDLGQAPISRAMTARVMDEFTRMSAEAIPEKTAIDLLTRRELDVLHELSKGLSNQEIAASLYISEYTVKNHLHSILDKLGVSNRREAIKSARRFGISAFDPLYGQGSGSQGKNGRLT